MSRENNECIIVFVTAGSDQEADLLREKLLEQKLAACVSKTNVNSLFSWKNEIQSENEVLLIIKTKKSLYGELEALILEWHSYDVPEIIALPIIAGSKPYLEWIDEVTEKNN
ncbi:MAG: divalent-cation tolerance protein CutA [Candidatus Omnitrophica bacterium]|nr:divalent-cation tolerance protein CutA [Candidatus Omnitrophota bacterium]